MDSFFLIQAHLSIGIHYQQTLIINVYKNKAQLAPSSLIQKIANAPARQTFNLI